MWVVIYIHRVSIRDQERFSLGEKHTHTTDTDFFVLKTGNIKDKII